MNLKKTGLILLLVLLAGGVGFFFGHHRADNGAAPDADDSRAAAPADDEAAPVHVNVAPIRLGRIAETIKAYGTVIADPSEVRILSVPFESRIGRVRATPGEAVDADTELLDLEASPDTAVALRDAQNAFTTTSKDFQQTQQRFTDHLATNQELSQAQQSLDSAKLKLNSLIERGADKTQHIRPPSAGIVSKVDVQEGQIVLAGAALAEIAAENRIQVKLGLEPDDAASLQTGQVVRLRRVEGASADEIEGHIRLIGKRVDPSSRLVDLLVTPPTDAHLMLESFIAGTIERAVDQAIIVPRQAIVSEEDGAYAIYTIEKGHAQKHAVRIGIENQREAQIICDDVKPGEMVAVSATYVLDDGAAVETSQSRGLGPRSRDDEQSPDPATTESTSNPAGSP